ncbi:MAG: TetR/AcrR family transcriptional regulator [Enhydrobacter sp.]|nr:TetR/AcrR family transcriptional regulator [Enhydrobacter sp.]
MRESGKIGVRQARAGEARQRLLRSAAKLFARRPYETVEVDDIVGRAGMAHGSLFHHFGSKRGIYLAAMEEIAAHLRARRADRLREGAEGPIADMEAQYASIADNPAFFVSLMRGSIGADADVQQIFERDRWTAIEAKARQLGLESTHPAVRIALRGWIASADQAALTWIELDRPFALSCLVASFLPTLSAALDTITRLDPSVDLSAARAFLETESARLAVGQ